MTGRLVVGSRLVSNSLHRPSIKAAFQYVRNKKQGSFVKTKIPTEGNFRDIGTAYRSLLKVSACAMGNKYYAVRVGRRPGIYHDWSDVQPLVSGYPGAQHKSFKTRFQAEAYLAAGPAPPKAAPKRGRDGYGSEEDDYYPPPPAQIPRRSDLPTDRHRPPQVVTSGILIVNSYPPPPRPHGGGSSNPVYSRPSSRASSYGGSRYDPVVEGPLVPIRKGHVYDLEFDGAARGNPGQAGCGAVLRYNGDVVCRLRKYMGTPFTNNEAEYTALIEGLKLARRLGVSRVHAQGDSKLVVQQVGGGWRINKEHLQKLCDKVHEETRGLSEFKIRHIPREWNAEADKLSNDAIDLV